MRQNQSLRFYHIYLSFFIQTLTILNLEYNAIADEGAKHLGEGLKENKVRQNQSLRFYHIHLSYFIQTLTILNLEGNKIENIGAEHLGEGLKENKVRQKSVSSFLSYSSILFYTDTQHTKPRT